MAKRFPASALFLIVLAMVGSATAQPREQRPKLEPRRLYPISGKAESGKKEVGFIDKTGKLVIGVDRLPKNTLGVGDFHEGLAVFSVGNSEAAESAVGFIDESGAVVIAPRFVYAHDFSDDRAFVRRHGFVGFIDRLGKEVFAVDNPSDRDFHEGLVAVGGLGEKWGFMDRSGRWAIERQYYFADDFSEGLAGVEVDGKYGFINQKGEMVIEPRFLTRRGTEALIRVATSRFSEGLACVKVDGAGYGYIDKQGKFVIPPQFDRAQEFSEGLAWVVTNDGKIGWIDKAGRWVVTGVNGLSFSGELGLVYGSESYDWRYSEGLVPFYIMNNGRGFRGYMDQRGAVVIKPRGSEDFGILGPFLGGVALVYFFVDGRDGVLQKLAYIDRSGRFIWRER
jgi:hypothetical protein